MSRGEKAGGERPLALTMGDPAGIGCEITLLAWQTLHRTGPAFVLLGDATAMRELAAHVGLHVPVREVSSVAMAAATFPDALPVLAVAPTGEVIPGRPSAVHAAAVIDSIDRAVKLVMDGQASGVVTNPIGKKVLHDAGFNYPGHTEYLAALTRAQRAPIMMIASPGLRVVPATVHMPLRTALASITTELIVEVATGALEALKRDFGIHDPRLAIAGLNPHAGEGGTLGREDMEIVAPAVDLLLAQGARVFGPLSPDTMFTPDARRTYDAALCLYHDQALIPAKTLDMDGGVNVTLNLPIVRTSPDHGTAYDLAGTGRARPASLIAAITMAAEIVRQRTMSGANCR